MLGINIRKEIMYLAGDSDDISQILQVSYGLVLVYMFIVMFHSLTRINFGRLLKLKSDQSTFLISILSSSVVYSYVSFSLYYNFAQSVMKLKHSNLVNVV